MRVTYAVRRAASRHPDAPATVFAGRRRSWREMERRIATCAAGLAVLGLQPGGRVAVLSFNSDNFVELLFAPAWADGAVVPLNVKWAIPELQYAIDDCGAEILVVGEDFAELGPVLLEACPTLRHIVHADIDAPEGGIGLEALIAGHAAAVPVDGPDNELYGIFYTGGTTGYPKGVMLSHRNVLSTALSWIAGTGYGEGNAHLHSSGLFYLAGAGQVWFATLAGATNVVLRRFVADEVLAIVPEVGVTSLTLVPTMVNMLLSSPMFTPDKLSSVRLCVYGGSPIPEALLASAIDKLPTWQFVQAYGMTETSGMCTLLAAAEHSLDAGRRGRLRSAGKPSHVCELRIVDEARTPTAAGMIGEIAVRGDNVMLGYWNKPGLTQASLSDGWLYTGDLARWDADGFLFIVDRMKDMIVSGGENVYSAEVENALHAHPAVHECAVFGIPDPKWGELVHAVIVTRPGMAVSGEEVIAHCQQLIARFKCPKSVEVRTEPLPKSVVGKILKRELRDPFWSGQSRGVH